MGLRKFLVAVNCAGSRLAKGACESFSATAEKMWAQRNSCEDQNRIANVHNNLNLSNNFNQ